MATGAPAASAPVWRSALDDTRLDGLVSDTLAQNPDIRMALSRIDQAAAIMTTVGAVHAMKQIQRLRRLRAHATMVRMSDGPAPSTAKIEASEGR